MDGPGMLAACRQRVGVLGMGHTMTGPVYDVAGRRALPAWRGGPPRLPGVAG